jgi:hypothetical protein
MLRLIREHYWTESFILYESRVCRAAENGFMRCKRHVIQRTRRCTIFRILTLVRTKTFRWSGSDPSSLLGCGISILRHELLSAAAVGSSRYFAVYPITGGLSDRSIGVARRTDIKLAFRQVPDWQSSRRKGRESFLRNETYGAFAVDIFFLQGLKPVISMSLISDVTDVEKFILYLTRHVSDISNKYRNHFRVSTWTYIKVA